MCAQPASSDKSFQTVSEAVERLYDAYPFPPETVLDEPPLGYNWRWHYSTAYAFCKGVAPRGASPRILDAGCGTGESTSYLAHLNPDSEIVAIDLSKGALDVAEDRLRRGVPDAMQRVRFVHKSIFDVNEIDGLFDYINCVGVIHHTPDPLRALRALADKLAPGGLIHLFVYAAHGRWEISLMQRALKILRGGADSNFEDGVRLARSVFDTLPEDNRLKQRERDRWQSENKKDATFADMYLHPQEVDYDIPSLFELIDNSGLQFVSMSNPAAYNLERVLKGNDELIRLANSCSLREQYQLTELLDPESVTHFEFFLAKPPFTKISWTDDTALGEASAERGPCMSGWPSTVLLDRDYTPVMLSDAEVSFVKCLEENHTIGSAVKQSGVSFDAVRKLIEKSIILVHSKQ